MSAASTPHLRREAVVAALLVGCVVVLLGLASGLGLTAPSAQVAAAPQTVTSVPPPATTATQPATVAQPPTAYVAVPPAAAPAVVPVPSPPVTVTSAPPAPAVTSTAASRPAPGSPTAPSTPAPSPVSCPNSLLSTVVGLLDQTLSGDLVTGLLGAVLGGLDLGGLAPVATLTPQQRQSQVRALLLGPLRPQASVAGNPADVATACSVSLDERIAAATQ